MSCVMPGFMKTQAAGRLVLALRGLLLLVVLFAASCGAADGLVIVKVSGLAKEITALYVTIQLDGVAATNSKPQTGVDTMTFVVYDEMQRFGVQIPRDTRTVGLSIVGYNTSLVRVRAGSGTLELAQGSEIEITLQ